MLGMMFPFQKGHRQKLAPKKPLRRPTSGSNIAMMNITAVKYPRERIH